MMKTVAAGLAALVLAGTALAAPPPTVERALGFAGDNRPQLERVLEHYRASGDAQKLAAAEFLIANMEGHGYIEHGFFTEDGKEIPFDALEYKNFDEAREAFEALEEIHGPMDYASRAFHRDLETITAEFLIENVDLAFEVWRTRPWAKGVSFEAFCEFILPYRGSNEPLNSWRPTCMERFANVSGKLEDPTSLDEAGRVILGDARRWVRFSTLYYLHPTDQGFDEMLETKTGRCEDMTNMMGYACRANGVMIAADYTPWWARSDNNHAWEVRLDAEGRGNASITGAAKIYRKTYSVQPDALGAVKDEDEPAPKWLDRRTYKDVTAEYDSLETTDVTVRLTQPAPAGARYAYLCVFNGGEWRAIHWGRIVGDRAKFTDMGHDIAYLPAYYVDEKLVPAAPPRVLTATGWIEMLDGDPAETTLVIPAAEHKKMKLEPAARYELFAWNDGWVSQGTRTHDANENLAFDGVPAGSLYWLVGEGSRKLERIFTVDDGAVTPW